MSVILYLHHTLTRPHLGILHKHVMHFIFLYVDQPGVNRILIITCLFIALQELIYTGCLTSERYLVTYFIVTLEPRISFENEHMEVIMCVQVSLPKC